MRYILIAAFLVGCGGEPMPTETKSPVIDAVGDPMECRVDSDNACHCTIPEFSSAAIEAMGNRCNFLRSIDPY